MAKVTLRCVDLKRSWKPSVSCLESIAFVSREVSQAEMDMDQFDAMSVGDGQYCGATTCMPTLQDKGVGSQLPPRVLNSDFRRDPLSGDKGRYSLVDGDLAFWFWESVFSATDSDFCPRKHAEAMALPQADKVRTAEIAEYGSHVQNGTFGPALEPGEFTPGMALKAVWVYSRSKKEPGAFKARLVMQGFLMQQGLHFNDVHAPVPAVTSFRVFMLGVALQGRTLVHWDVKTAFLTTPMDCQVDVTFPEAFNSEKGLQPEARRGTTRHRVLKVIPGCPQGSRLWHAHISEFLAGGLFRTTGNMFAD